LVVFADGARRWQQNMAGKYIHASDGTAAAKNDEKLSYKSALLALPY
jgi:hypothetical protein